MHWVRSCHHLGLGSGRAAVTVFGLLLLPLAFLHLPADRAAWFQRLAFNMGMWNIASAAGGVYVATGGSPTAGAG